MRIERIISMRLVGYIFISGRYWNMFLTAVSVWIGYYYGSGFFWDKQALYAAVSAAFICGGGNIINDYCGVESDRVNKPHRPYASGKISGINMIISGILFWGIGFSMSFLINKSAVIIASIVVISLILYNFLLKEIMLTGNILVGLLSGLSFIYGSAAGDSVFAAFFPALFSFLFILAREILKDIEDYEGDAAADIVTFPVKYGKNAAIILSVAIFLVLIVFSIIPYLFFFFSFWYLVIVLCGTDLVIAGLLIKFLLNPHNANLRKTNSRLKIGILFGMIALIVK